jgi:hypothetical protein
MEVLVGWEALARGKAPVDQIKKTSLHEIGHGIFKGTEDIHIGHSAAPWNKCVGSPGFSEQIEWCPKHAAMLRRNATRAWETHDSTKPGFEHTRDSD